MHRTVVLVPGVHAAGIDEPRLVGFAQHLAEAGLAVVTPELSDLKRHEITARGSDVIEDSAKWALGQPALAPDGRVGLMGISFGGGLSVVSFGRPALRNGVAFVFSFGGYGDLSRVLRYLCTGRQPEGTYRAPHDYGVVIILLGAADRVVPPEQVEPLRAGIRTFLTASQLDPVDPVRARVEFENAKRMQAALPEPAATLMGYVNARNVKALGALLIEIATEPSDPAISPERSPSPTAPVYLLHGADDNVIPAVESTLLAQHLAGRTCRTLITSLITHAEIDRPARIGEVLALVEFWSAALRE